MSLDPLLAAAGRYPLLTPALEIELGRQIRAWQAHPDGPAQAPADVQRRGRRALNKFVSCNLRLAHYVARRFRNRGLPMEDLMQAATEGLITAAQRFEPRLGYRFSSYGVWYALQSCQTAVAHQAGAIRLPTTVSETIRKVERTREQLRLALGRDPSDEELEEAAKLRPGQLEDLKLAGRMSHAHSLHAPLSVSGEGGGSGLDFIASSHCPQSAVALAEFRELIRDLVQQHPELNPQQRYLLQCRYLNDGPTPTLARMASLLHMNRETLRRMERQALDLLKDALPEATEDYRALLSSS